MKSIFKQTKIIIIIGFVGICFTGCSFMGSSFFAGIFYPKVVFSFKSLGENPPSVADDRLSMGAKYPQIFKIRFSQAGNSFKKSFLADIFVDEPYKMLNVKELSYTWQEGEGVFYTDKVFEIGGYLSANGWYWTQKLGEPLYRMNFEKIFKNKKPGDTFWFTLKIVFSFDDGPEQTQILEYNVVTVKKKYSPLFYF